MQYALKLKSNPSNPTYETVFEQQYKTFENKPNMIPSFGIRISSEFENMNLDLDNIADYKISDVPPWTLTQPRVLFSLHKDKKSQTDHIVFRTKFHELLSYFPNYETIFTDGSIDGDTAGSACVTPSDTYKCRLPDDASIFSAEIKAIDLALDHIEQSRSSDFIIFSDSLSVLQSHAGASYNFDYSRARAYCACSRCGWGWFGHFYSHLSFLFFLPLFRRRLDID